MSGEGFTTNKPMTTARLVAQLASANALVGSTNLLEQPPEADDWPKAGAPQPHVNDPGTPSVPASTVAQVNNRGCRVAVFVKGGTLTVISIGGVATGITVEAPANTCHILPLAPGQTIAITYTVAPTWVWIGQ